MGIRLKYGAMDYVAEGFYKKIQRKIRDKTISIDWNDFNTPHLFLENNRLYGIEVGWTEFDLDKHIYKLAIVVESSDGAECNFIQDLIKRSKLEWILEKINGEDVPLNSEI